MGKMPQIRKKALPVRFPRNTCSHIFFSLGKPSLSFQFLHSILSEYFPGSQRRSCTDDSRQTLGRPPSGLCSSNHLQGAESAGWSACGVREVCFRHGLSSGGNLHPRFQGHTDFELLLWQHADRVFIHQRLATHPPPRILPFPRAFTLSSPKKYT